MTRTKRKRGKPIGRRKGKPAKPKAPRVVSLGRDARRRVQVGSVLVDYINSNHAPNGVVRIPVDKLVARDADGDNSVITSAEIEFFLKRMVAIRRIRSASKIEDGYMVKVAVGQPKSPAVKRKVHRELSLRRELASLEVLMRAVLYASGSEYITQKQLRKRVLARLEVIDSRQIMNRNHFVSNVAACIDSHCAQGNIRRDGKLLLRTDVGKKRLNNNKPFSSGELPKNIGRDFDKSLKHKVSTRISKEKTRNILVSIPKMTPDRLIVVWNNAIRKLADQSRRMDHQAALRIVEAVESAWDALQILEDDYFKWPSTETDSRKSGATIPEMQKDGMLSYLEYRVGKTADIPVPVRQLILARVFEGRLPRVFPLSYMRQWGDPETPLRLRKMAESIASFARNAKRRDDSRLDEAIRQWEQDLEFLYDKYFVGRFGFGWPSTSI